MPDRLRSPSPPPATARTPARGVKNKESKPPARRFSSLLNRGLNIGRIVLCIHTLFAACLGGLIYVCYLKRGLFRDPTPFFDKENRLVLGPYRAAHLFACIAFSVALVVTMTAYLWTPQGTKKQVAMVICTVNFISAVTYAVLATDLSTPISFASSEHYDPIRYLQWMFTTPSLILGLSCLARTAVATTLVKHAIALDEVMIITGLLERYTGGVVQMLLIAASCAAFGVELTHLKKIFALADDALAVPADRTIINRMSVVTFTVWTMFPLVRGLSYFHVVGPFAEEMLFILLDLFAKLGYSVSLMVGNFTRTDQVLQERLSRYEDLLQTTQTKEEDDAAVSGVFAAHAEAASWKEDRRARLLSAGVPEQQAEVFLDAAVGEYIAFAHGRLGAFGIPQLRPS